MVENNFIIIIICYHYAHYIELLRCVEPRAPLLPCLLIPVPYLSLPDQYR